MTKNAKYQSDYYYRHKTSIKKAVFDILGDKCSICGFNDKRALEMDHILGGGKKHKLKVGGIGYYKEMLELAKAKKIRTLCRNCNRIEYIKLNPTHFIVNM